MNTRLFFSTTIGSHVFDGVLSVDGPFISCNETNGGVALGVCGLKKFKPTDMNSRLRKYGWWVVKYDDEPRIDLHEFTDEQAMALSHEFGIVVLSDESSTGDPVRQDYFFTSPAWEGLCEWVKKRPRIAAETAKYQSYLPNWFDRASRTQAVSN